MAPRLDFTRLAVVYARQSTPEQVEQNVFSTEGQPQLERTAIQHGFPADNVLIIADDMGVSGRTIEGRIGMTRALDMMAQGLVAAVYAEDVTRLSRDAETVDHMLIARQCRRADVPLFMGGSWRDMRDYASRLAFKYEAVGASEQWSQTVEKLQRTKRQAAEQGRVVGRLPRGYRKWAEGSRRDPAYGTPVIHEGEAAVIREVLARLPEARSVRHLYDLIHPTYWPDGELVTYVKLQRILKQPIYRGIYTWHDIEAPCPAILTPEQARDIDQMLALNKSTLRKPAKTDQGMLAGLVWCSSCDRKMHPQNHQTGRVYSCFDRRPGLPYVYHFGVLGRKIEGLVLDSLWHRIENGLIDSIVAHLETKKAEVIAIADVGEAQKRILTRKVEGLTKSLSNAELTDVARRVLIAELNEAAAALEAYQARIPKARSIDVDLAHYEKLKRDREFLLSLPVSWEDQPMAWRKSFLRRFIRRITVTVEGRARRVTIEYADGVTSDGNVLNQRWTPEELELLRTLMASPDKPD